MRLLRCALHHHGPRDPHSRAPRPETREEQRGGGVRNLSELQGGARGRKGSGVRRGRKRVPRIKTACPTCEAPVFSRPARPQTYCSRACQWRSMGGRATTGASVCEACGEKIPPRPAGKYKGKLPRFCSRRCAGKAGGAAAPKPRGCVMCGAEFMAGHKRRTCSDECRVALSEETRAKKKVARERALAAIPCGVCGRRGWAALPFAKYCSAQCVAALKRQRYEDSYGRDRSPRPCIICDTSFSPEYGDKRRAFCSDRCRKRMNQGNVNRARHRGLPFERFDEQKVFIRDGWRCQLCGKKLDPKQRGTQRARAPVVDHIVALADPRSLGHVWENVQAACHPCNSSKRARSRGQLLIPGTRRPPRGGSRRHSSRKNLLQGPLRQLSSRACDSRFWVKG